MPKTAAVTATASGARVSSKRPAASEAGDKAAPPRARKKPKTATADPDHDVKKLQAEVDAYDVKINEHKDTITQLQAERAKKAVFLDVLAFHGLPACALAWVRRRECHLKIHHNRVYDIPYNAYHAEVIVGSSGWSAGPSGDAPIYADASLLNFPEDLLGVDNAKASSGKKLESFVAAATQLCSAVPKFLDVQQPVDDATWKAVAARLEDGDLEFLVCVRSFRHLEAYVEDWSGQEWDLPKLSRSGYIYRDRYDDRALSDEED